jgi:hypothetical protein
MYRSVVSVDLLGFCLLSSGLIFGCGDPDTSFIEARSDGTDPYCAEIDDWASEVTLTATFSHADDIDRIVVGFEPHRTSVKMGSLVDAASAELESIFYDTPDLWLVLRPVDGTEIITIDGTISCAYRQARFTLTLLLDPATDSIDTSLVFSEGDADGGLTEPDAGPSAR